MYFAKSRARLPFVIALPAMFAVGSASDAGRPAFCASAAIAVLFMSGVPTMYSCFRLDCTVSRPFMPITIAATPKPTSTTAAMSPPISNALRMTRLLSIRSAFPPVCCVLVQRPSGRALNPVAERPSRALRIVRSRRTRPRADGGAPRGRGLAVSICSPSDDECELGDLCLPHHQHGTPSLVENAKRDAAEQGAREGTVP